MGCHHAVATVRFEKSEAESRVIDSGEVQEEPLDLDIVAELPSRHLQSFEQEFRCHVGVVRNLNNELSTPADELKPTILRVRFASFEDGR